MIGCGGTTVLNIQLHAEEVNDWMALFLYPFYSLYLFSNQRHCQYVGEGVSHTQSRLDDKPPP